MNYFSKILLTVLFLVLMGNFAYGMQNEKQTEFSEKIKKEHCFACFRDFEDGESVTELECAHVFHIECIDRWFRAKRKPSCPYCFKDINLKKINTLMLSYHDGHTVWCNLGLGYIEN